MIQSQRSKINISFQDQQMKLKIQLQDGRYLSKDHLMISLKEHFL